MDTLRHAASVARRRRRGTALSVLAMVLGGALALVVAVWGAIAVAVARRVVHPAGRLPDTRILDLDTAAQTIRLSRTPDTQLPGRYGLFTSGSLTYLKLGAVLGEDDRSVTRKLLTQVRSDERLEREAAFSGWYFDDPGQLQLPFSAVQIGTPLGPCPAWLFPAATPSTTWVVQVHGWGTDRTECLRSVPVFRDLGITSLLVSYRNDGVGPRSRGGSSALGSTEWQDVDAAIGYARRHGAERVLLMGWSMGGAVVLQTALDTPHSDAIAGIILESPVVEWRTVLGFQARAARIPNAVAGLALTALGSSWAIGLTRADAAIPFDRLDVLTRAGELRHPILILHSDDDGFVPSDGSHDLARARPDLVDLHVFSIARHTKLWNYDQERWSSVISDWVTARGLSASGSPASSPA